MARLMVTMFVSLDGVLQAPGGDDEVHDPGYEHGGWAAPLIKEQVIERMTDLIGRADALLLGRNTYDIFAATWPLAGPDDPIGVIMNKLPKYVASRTPRTLTWQNSEPLTGDVVEAVADLKRREDGEIQVHGSGGLIQTLLEHDLVDEFHLLVFPVLLGSGKRLFAEGTVPAGLRLVESTTLDAGVVVSRYARAGALAYGAIGPETENWSPGGTNR
ncbi:dihydrofolate reductase family protein [Pseudonocardia acaciae]|uniref:dihydrofolate reductase family protein n=1 Tax=Pseudonocardia acaciae TaxID=551276 RepID=UPI00048D8DBE|nr:dihydrofolate reductase family protein [Pseudonocardia acaciae]